ncbi:MAG: endonuclease/exonuclease/phosphatase family protein [Oligoflexus sp.]
MIRLMLVVCFFLSSISLAQIRVASFNLESGGADIDYLLEDLKTFGRGVHIWGFQEVYSYWYEPIIEGLSQINGEAFQGVLGKSGGGDRLLIAYNPQILELESFEELEWINIQGRVRAPLVASLRIISSGERFKFVNNHLYRSRASDRHQQARLLNEWGRQSSVPIVAVGDYNFDWDLQRKGRDLGYDLLTKDETFQWVQPDELIKTQCSPRYNTILDFIFLSSQARSWKASSKIKFPEPEYCDKDPFRSDHRPVTALIYP